MKTTIATPHAPSSALYSQGARVGPFIFVSGMTGTDVATAQLVGPGIEEQTTQALGNCVSVIEAGGGSRSDIVQVTVLLANPEDFVGMNESYAGFFPSDPPTRAVAKLGVELPGVRISVLMTAYVKEVSEVASVRLA